MFFAGRGVCAPGVVQDLQSSCELSWYWPATQSTHCVRGATARWPLSHWVQLAALVPVLIWPGGQSAQRPSLLYRPLTTTKRPAAQAGVGLVVGDAVG
jgi:hypothetical protein